MCWINPVIFFTHFAQSDAEKERIMQSIRLPAHEACQEEHEPSTPEVDGLPREERDKLRRDLNILAKEVDHSSKWNSNQFHKLLMRLGWDHGEANWTTKWWKHEKVYLPPYSDREG